MGLTILRCRGLQKPPKQGHRGSDVLGCPGEVWEGFIVLDDPPIHITGHGARTPTIFMVLNLSFELCAFLLELESCFLELLVLGLQLLYPQVRWGPYIPLDLIVEAIRWGSLSLMDAFDVSLEGTYHKTFTREVMAPPTRVKVGG